MDATWKPDRDDIISATAKDLLERSQRPFYENLRGFRFSPKDVPDDVFVWVKHSLGGEPLRCEANTQYFVHSEISKMDDATRRMYRAPKVFDFFEAEIDELPYGILVMESVTGVPVSGVMRDIRRQNTEQRERGIGLVEGSASDDSLQQHQEQEHQQERHNKMASETQQRGQETTENPLAQPHNKEDEQKRILDGELLPLKNRVADAICFLLSLPKPPDTRPGLVSGTFPDLPPLRFVHEGLRLCYCDLNFDNLLLEDAEDPSGSIIIIDFEHASWPPYSFLIWEAWDKREFAMEERIRSRFGLELSRENVYALFALLRQREWDSAITISPSPSWAAV
ncbi:Putative aminoglycoside phosphotransferase, protein kinase-like domain superfamily [Colletotrichum destructivum]|uniref:Aminoglycoside phosphotransferase, protein kinase-like domain superfamily n=1 Tax=Colletotrichum destructivum TaxID=34406 RepID=A0AAX4IDK7_9PEZI|nr:Putative aminoglycoside phosphotransferase, protein kinase-like domain superfamily [Colletotrichum destructivum]